MDRENDMQCELCRGEIEDGHFTLSDLTVEGGLLTVCRTCAASQYIVVEVGGLKVEVHRDDFIEADREKLELAISEVTTALEEGGWVCEGLKVRGIRRR